MIDDISQTIFVATINWYAWMPSRIMRLLLMSKLLVAYLSRFCTNKNIYFAIGYTRLLISISMIQHHHKIIISRYFTHISISWSDGQDLSNICLVATKNNTAILVDLLHICKHVIKWVVLNKFIKTCIFYIIEIIWKLTKKIMIFILPYRK